MNINPPFFIGSIGRSGSTLLSLMLDSHRDIKCGPELHFRGPRNLGPYILEAMDYWGKKRPEWPEHLVSGIQFIARCVRFGETVDGLWGAIRKKIATTGSDIRAFEERCRLIDLLGTRRLYDSGKNVWGLKIMADICQLDKYYEQFPGARFINIYKDPREAALSLSKVGWGPGDIRRTAAQWMTSILEPRKRALECGAQLLEVRFEDLVLEPDRTMRRVLDFLGEEWDPNVLHHHEMVHSFLTNPYGHPSAQQVAKPVDPSYVGKWQKGLTTDQVKEVEKQPAVRCLMKSLGYNPKCNKVLIAAVGEPNANQKTRQNLAPCPGSDNRPAAQGAL